MALAKVLVVADMRRGKLRNVTFEMLGAASAIANGDAVAITLLGKNVAGLAKDLGDFGADAVYVVDAPELENYNSGTYRKALLTVIDQFNPGVLLLAHSAIGRDLAPMVAARLGAGQVSDITSFEGTGENLTFVRSIYAGKAFTKVSVKQGLAIATVRPNNLTLPAGGVGKPGTVQNVSVSFEPADLATLVKEIMAKANQGVDLTEAKVVVAGGRGVKDASGFTLLEQLADVLGGAVGSSRGACDAGYCDYSLQIGQTGKVVTPDLYIACGISGAIQHLAGMSNSKVIVAINKDPEAPIFQMSDYGIVGDLLEVVPRLTEEFKKILV
ncbi:electron transfer flavoprotein subunit alpha/FixB family protein [Alicyclobacillaceae bacterium I2511]|nr:electron transfer flavoprotein subunit alpha/FixB family protein [Alicyclobacillaceae bacterium I2511]